jgi:pimeloyl-ACP methyl ester carboxylesterase
MTRLEFLPAAHDGALACWIAQPDRPAPAAPPLVAVHGIRRDARAQAALFGPRAAALGRVVVAPVFDAERWPRYQRLGGGADRALLALLQRLRSLGRLPAGRVELFGFSGGAQFAHRFALLHPGALSRLCVACAGWYTFPDAEAYPLGLGGDSTRAARMRERIDDFLRLPIDVCVGALDTRRDRHTRRGATIDAQQGRHRRERASRWSEALAIEAAVRGHLPRVRLAVLPGCGHDFRRCMLRGGLAERVLHAPLELRALPPHRPPTALAPLAAAARA